MFVSNFLLKRAFELSTNNDIEKAKIFLDYYLHEIDEIKCHDRMVFGNVRLCSGCKPDDLNVRMPISWEILEKQGHRLLLLSEFCLDWDFYDGNCLFLGPAIDTTWENSTIRESLNKYFFENSFKGIEKDLIVTTQVKTNPNPIYGNNPGNDTQDKIFLLSSDEVIKYFAGKDGNPLSEREIDKENVYAKSLNERYFYLGNSSASADIIMAEDLHKDQIDIYRENYNWWLRTPGIEQTNVSVVTEDGIIDFDGISSNADEVGIRPALWIDLDIAKDIIYSKANS